MYDSVNASAIPADAEMVAGYVDGRYTWSMADWNRFPNAYQVTITIGPSNAHVLDIETGNAAPADAPAWIVRQHAWIKFPSVYCNLSNLQAIRDACTAAGLVQGTDYDLWIADYTQVPHCPDWAAACQYADPGPYDLSLCNDWWPRDVVPQGGGFLMLTDAEQKEMLDAVRAIFARTDDSYNGVKYGITFDYGQGKDRTGQPAGTVALQSAIQGVKAKLDSIPVGGGLTGDQIATLAAIATTLTRVDATLQRIEAALRAS